MATKTKKPKRKAAPKKKPLTREQKLARRRDRNPLYDPTAQLSGNRLAQAASDLTDLEFKPKESALEGRLQTATQQGTALAGRASDYYRQIAAGEADRIAQQQALKQRLGTELDVLGANTQQKINQAKGEADASARADAELRGAGLSGGGDQKLADEFARRQLGAALTAQGYKADAELQSGNYEGLQRSLAGTRELRGGEVQGQLLNRLATEQAGIRQQQADLASTEGETRTKHLLDLRQSGFENLATMEGLGIKREDIAAQAETARASQRAKTKQLHEVSRSNKAKERLAAKSLGETKHHHRSQESTAQQNAATAAARAAKPSKKGSAADKTRILNARSDILKAQGIYRSQFRGQSQKYFKALGNKGYNPAVLRAGFELENQGYIGPHTAQLLRDLHVTVPSRWLKAKPRRASSPGGQVGANIAAGARLFG